MRELIFAIILTLAILLIASCKKEEQCYECTIRSYTFVSYPTPGYPKTDTYNYETCEGDQSDYFVSTASAGSIQATTQTTVTCVLK